MKSLVGRSELLTASGCTMFGIDVSGTSCATNRSTARRWNIDLLSSSSSRELCVRVVASRLTDKHSFRREEREKGEPRSE